MPGLQAEVEGGERVNACEKCRGSGFVETTVERVYDGVVKVFPALTPCECALRPAPPGAPPAVVKPPRGGDSSGVNWEVEAAAWIAKNPAIIEVFLRMARAKAGRGRRFGIGALTEVVRWECDDPEVYGSDFKINNNFRAYIARHLVALDRNLERFIEFRETRF